MFKKIIEKIKVGMMLRRAYKDYKKEYPKGTYQGFGLWLDGSL